MILSLERASLAIAIAAAVALFAAGVRFGTFAAGGSDSYCYLNGAELLAAGKVRDVEPLAGDPAWPGSPAAFAPTGHAVTADGTASVPICPAGYPLMMAAARLAGGRTAMFVVTPLMGALLVMSAYIIGRELAGPPTGAATAVLSAASPIVLYQVVQPMNDIPAAAVWSLVLACLLNTRWTWTRRSALAGLAAGLALTIRPNLLPLAAVCGLAAAWLPVQETQRTRIASAALFGLAALPGVLFVLAIQNAMYGSPLRSGYGDLDQLFSWAHVLPNLSRYPRWLLETQTPIVLLALLAPVIAGGQRRQTTFLVVFCAALLFCYLPYVVFDAWWYLRFLLPGLVPLFALTITALHVSSGRLLPAWRHLVVLGAALLLAAVYVGIARDRQAFELQRLEARFAAAGQFVTTLPANAVVITEYQSGSVRFYSGRTSVLWGEIPRDRLGDALAFLRARGRKPYLLFERWEEPLFKERFAGHHPLGTLEWPPIADVDRSVRIFDPDDYERYRRGEYVRTEQVFSRRRR